MEMIEVHNLTKSFVAKKGSIFKRQKEVVRAVDGISFDIKQGEIFSLLGPNGAGKTTTIKMLATLLIPTSGIAFVKGYDITKNDLAVRKVLTAVLPGERTLYWKLSVRENLQYFGSLYGLKSRFANGKIDQLLDFFGLAGKRKTLVEKLSTGQRQKVVLSRAMLPEPEVILLDEPTLGLDPTAAISLRQMIRKIAHQGTTVLLTTHYMYEADELSSRVAIIDGGKIVCLDTPVVLKKSLQAKKIIRISVDRWDENLSNEFSARFGALSIDYHKQHEQVYLRTKYEHSDIALDALSQFFESCRVSAANISIDEPSLEDVFIEKTGESISEREETGAGAILA